MLSIFAFVDEALLYFLSILALLMLGNMARVLLGSDF